MPKRTLVSVIIPVHNPGEYLKECLDSVVGQTYKNIEIIIINDDSTDDSESVIKDYEKKDSRIKYYTTKQHNAALTRRVGLNKSRGSYVCFVDSDDIVSTEYVGKLLDLVKDTGLSLATAKIEHFNRKDDIVLRNRGTGEIEIESDLLAYFGNNYHTNSSSKYIAQSVNAKIFKRELLDVIDYSVVKTSILEDNYIVSQVLKAVVPSKIACLDMTLYYYRTNPNSTMASLEDHIVLSDGKSVTYVELFDETMAYLERLFENSKEISYFTHKLKSEEYHRLASLIPAKNNHIKHVEQLAHEYKRQIDRLEGEVRDYEKRYDAITDSRAYRAGRLITGPDRVSRNIKNKALQVHITARRRLQRVANLPGDLKTEAVYKKELAKITQNKSDKAIVLHLYYIDMWPYFAKRLAYMIKTGGYDLFVNIPHRNSREARDLEKDILHEFPDATVLYTPNKGRDVLSFMKIAKVLSENGYDHVLKLHSKKSPQRQDGENWSDEIISRLTATNKKKLHAIEHVFSNTRAAIIGPSGSYVPLNTYYNDNHPKIHWLLSEIYNKEDADNINANNDSYGFFAGTMFWVRLSAIESVVNLPLTANNFPPESAQLDGTVAHALERLFCIVPEYDNMDIYEAERDSVRQISHKTTFIPEWSDYYHEK